MKRLLCFTLLLILVPALGQDSAVFWNAVSSIEHEIDKNLDRVKHGSEAFLLHQGQPSKTVVLIHGLSDSAGSMREVASVYFREGFNVYAILLRDHGLIREYRDQARKKITLNDWRQDVDRALGYAFKLSDSGKVSLGGYSMGGALVLDTSLRYANKIASISLFGPMIKMKFSSLARLSKVLRHLFFSSKKGVGEEDHFYPDIAYNQIYHASKLSRYIGKKLFKRPVPDVVRIPKIMYLIHSDSTVKNKSALKAIGKINISEHYIYRNKGFGIKVLHRDLTMPNINASGERNPHLQHLKSSLADFLSRLKENVID